jgi:hypothetical protein
MAEETLAQKIRVGGFSFKDEAKLAEAIEAFESEYLGNIGILSDEERKNLPRGKQLIQRQIRQFVQNTVRTYKQEKRRRAQQEEDNDDIFE